MRTRLFQFALIVSVAAGLLKGQETTPPPAAPPAAPAPAVSPAAPAPEATPAAPALAAEPVAAAPVPATTPATPATGVSRSHDTLSVDFPDEDIRTILRNVADLFELNLVVPDTLQGKTSIKLHDVTWRQVFEVVLTPVGYTYIDQSGIIKVVSLESLNQEPVTTEVFVLSYARASDVQPNVAPLIENAVGGKLGADARSNSLIITERPSRLNRIRPLIKQLDKATDQVMIESKFVEVTNSDVKNIGINWSSLNGWGVSAGPFSSLTTDHDSHTRTNTNDDIKFMKDGYRKAATVAGVSSMGPTPTYVAEPWVKTPTSINDYMATYPNMGPATLLTDQMDRLSTAVFNTDAFKLILSALQTDNQTKIVSNPTVVTLNNTEAFINVGEEYPIPNYTFNQEHGTFEVSGFNYKPIGIILKVTPQVNASGFIKLTVEPTVSQRGDTVSFGGASGAQIPIIAERTAKTQVSMKDGYTMAIGGLIRTETINGGSKVPVLGKIPLLGKLFSSKDKSKTVNNLIIFITAKTISAEGSPAEETISPEQIRLLGMRRDELPGYRGGPDPFLPPGTPEDGQKK